MTMTTDPPAGRGDEPAFVRFELERLLSDFEHAVEINLSESGVHPLTMRQLLAMRGGDVEAAIASLADVELTYPHVNGDPELRDAIAALYPGATRDNVLVTVGAIQANYAAFLTVTRPGDDVAVMQPNYQQFWGLVQNHGRRLSTFGLEKELDWALDLEELERAVDKSTKLVTVVNPNNPTGRIMLPGERRAVVEAAGAAGAWLLADEVYTGAERVTDEITPSFYGEYDKVLAVNSLSKGYGLPGLRIGWIVGPPDTIADLWAWQDYVTICSTMLANKLAAIALSPEVRSQILARTRGYVRRGFENVARWAAGRDDVEVMAPDAAAVCFVKYAEKVNSTDLVMKLIDEKSVFVAPGDVFGLDGHLRISFGLPDDYVNEGLRRLGEALDESR
jgi:aspartate/methionine/tyrosine aminotransferase